MSYRRNERQSGEWHTGALRDPYDDRGGGRHRAHRPNPVNRRDLVEQLYDLYDDDEAEGEDSLSER